MNTLDKVHNQLITYAYHIAQELESEAGRIQDQIIENQPKSNVPNKPLNVGFILEPMSQRVEQLKELEELSAKLYRVNNGLEKLEILVK